ncbi:hypothetical protein [Thermoplasma sp.]|uniref:hypothetical protein n=1 Tax=Thermoplasma sp. TaxID=1973142 RepID=UPI0026301DA9|nr:hypothetical protein [Thermoplasma sp.]
MKFLKYLLRTMVIDRRILVWSMMFSIFFDVLTVFFLSHIGQGPVNPSSVREIESIDYGLIFMLSMSFAAVSISSSFAVQSRSFGYLFRYTKATRSWYMLNLIVAMSILFLILGSIIFGVNWLFNYERYRIDAAPSSLPGIIALAPAEGLLVSGVTLATFSLFITYTGYRHLNYIRFLPIYIYFAADFSIIEAGVHGTLYYLSPFLSSTYLAIYLYSGSKKFPFNTVAPYSVDPHLALISLVISILISYAASIIFMKRIRSSGSDDERLF